MNANDFVVRMTDVSKSYFLGKVEVKALKSITLDIPQKMFNVIIGPSGSGKTTLLNLIGCIDLSTSGRVDVCGREIAKLSDREASDFRARSIGFIFQNFNLIPVLSAYENVEYPLLLSKIPNKERKDRVEQILQAVGLYEHRRHRPNELSGGQRQRVAIARSLIIGPKIVIADEPTANLDSTSGRSIIELMREMQSKNNTTFIISSHDTQIMDHADKTFVINDGKLIANNNRGTGV